LEDRQGIEINYPPIEATELRIEWRHLPEPKRRKPRLITLRGDKPLELVKPSAGSSDFVIEPKDRTRLVNFGGPEATVA
jgi:hypothetical protein